MGKKFFRMSGWYKTNAQWLYVVYEEMYALECHVPLGLRPHGT